MKLKLVLETLIPLLADLAGPALAVTAAYVARRVAQHFRLQEDERLDAAITQKVTEAIAYAEQMALQRVKASGSLPPGSDKLRWALQWAQRELEESGIVHVTAERLVDLIESRLGDPDTPGSAVEAMETAAELRLSRFRERVSTASVALLAVLLAGGCAGRAAQVHLKTAQSAHVAIELAADVIEATCTTARAEREGPAFAERCHRAVEGQHLAVEAHTAWTSAAATEGLDGPTVLARLGDLIRLYDELRDFAATYGRDLPEVF
ncbi:MAG: phage holin, LLH family [Myxococcota bacterium]